MRTLLLTALFFGQTAPLQTPTVEKRMGDHFSKVTQLRTAILTGDLAGARGSARWLAETEWSPHMSEEWRAPLQKLRSAAEQTRKSSDLAAAAAGLGQIGEACAGCHRALGGPRISVGQPPAPASGVKPHMARHAWAVEQMWLGLMAPSDEAWIRGTEALADAPLEAGAFSKTVRPSEVEPLARRIHALGERAHQAPPAQRAEAYGKLLATCASCHATGRPTARAAEPGDHRDAREDK